MGQEVKRGIILFYSPFIRCLKNYQPSEDWSARKNHWLKFKFHVSESLNIPWQQKCEPSGRQSHMGQGEGCGPGQWGPKASSGPQLQWGAPGITVGGRRLWKEKANSQKQQALHLQVPEAVRPEGVQDIHSSALLLSPHSGIFPQFRQKMCRKERCESMAKNCSILSHVTPSSTSYLSIYRQHYI